MLKKIPILLVSVYLVLVLLAAIPVFSGSDPLDAIFLVLLALPWSFVATIFVDSINPLIFDNIFVGLLVNLVAVSINAALLYFVSRWLIGRFRGR